VEVLRTVDAPRIRSLLDADTFFWLDLVGPSPDDLHVLAGLLGLHPAAVEDTVEWGQLPKVDDYGEHVVMVFFSAKTAAEAEGGMARPVEVHVYVSGDWMLTARREPTPLDRLHEWIGEAKDRSEDQLLYNVLDALMDGWDPVIVETDRRVDEVEVEVLERPRQGQLPAIYRLKQEVGDLMRHATPQREMFRSAIAVIHGLPGLTRGAREWLRDVQAHLDSVTSDLHRLWADLTALTETFFNANANRLNRLATLIAVGSVFFLVWTLVTSFFGQNFRWLVDHIDSRGDFMLFGVGGLVIPTVVLGAIAWWRRGDWW
jgi:magnesium transporter